MVKKKRGKTTLRVPGVRVAEDLILRDFTATEPNTKWVADITYLKSWQGWVYLAAVQDLYSRRIVVLPRLLGISPEIRASLINRATRLVETLKP